MLTWRFCWQAFTFVYPEAYVCAFHALAAIFVAEAMKEADKFICSGMKPCIRKYWVFNQLTVLKVFPYLFV